MGGAKGCVWEDHRGTQWEELRGVVWEELRDAVILFPNVIHDTQ